MGVGSVCSGFRADDLGHPVLVWVGLIGKGRVKHQSRRQELSQSGEQANASLESHPGCSLGEKLHAQCLEATGLHGDTALLW